VLDRLAGESGAVTPEERDALAARMRAGHARRFAWPEETYSLIRRLHGEGWTAEAIAREAKVTCSTMVKRAKARWGIDLLGDRVEARKRGDDVLRRLYASTADIDEVHAAYCEAVGRKVSRHAVGARARRLDLRRDGDQLYGQVLRATKVRLAAGKERRAALAPTIQRLIDGGMIREHLIRDKHISRGLLEALMRDGLVRFPPRQPRPVVAKPPRPPRPAKVAAPKPGRVPAPPPPRPVAPRPDALSIRAERPPPIPPQPAETIEAYLARGGRITRCPTAAVMPTTATVPAEDLAILRAHSEQMEREYAGPWKRRKDAKVARNAAKAAAAAQHQGASA
jgi:hypothetical protein